MNKKIEKKFKLTQLLKLKQKHTKYGYNKQEVLLHPTWDIILFTNAWTTNQY